MVVHQYKCLTLHFFWSWTDNILLYIRSLLFFSLHTDDIFIIIIIIIWWMNVFSHCRPVLWLRCNFVVFFFSCKSPLNMGDAYFSGCLYSERRREPLSSNNCYFSSFIYLFVDKVCCYHSKLQFELNSQQLCSLYRFLRANRDRWQSWKSANNCQCLQMSTCVKSFDICNKCWNFFFNTSSNAHKRKQFY